jgi:8-oxo-dGTP pyrophosphatase MutT (NUDIX family)
MIGVLLLALCATVEAFKGAGIQIMNKENVLLVQNLGSGKWGFPKGHREPVDQTWRDTAVREVEEETGLKENIDYMICSHAPDIWGARPYWTADLLRNTPLRINITEHRAVKWIPTMTLHYYVMNNDLAHWYVADMPVKCSSTLVV